jgi:hypothetical protein
MRVLFAAFCLSLWGCIALGQPAPSAAEVSGFNSAFGPPTVSFAADMYMETGGNMREGRLVYIPHRERWELRTGSVTVISILYTDLGVGYTVLPSQKMYLEVDQGAARANQTQWTAKREGDDTDDGLVRGRYRVEGVSPSGDTYKATMWLAEAYNLVVEVRGTSVTRGVSRQVHMKLFNIQVGPQDPALFEPPPDYKRFGTGLDAGTPPKVQP